MYYIGTDLGGSKIAAGAVDENFNIISKYKMQTRADKPAECIAEDIVAAAMTAIKNGGLDIKDCAGMGIGAPGSVDRKNGIVTNAWNLGWKNVELKKLVESKIKVKCEVANDADCAAYAETLCGSAIGYKNVILATIGTGFGGGFVINGEIYSGSGYSSTEPGHIVLVLDGEQCTCGRKGCIEAYASMTALKKQGKRAAENDPSSKLNNYEKLTGRIILDEAEAGDETAAAVSNKFKEYVGASITDLVNCFDP